MRIFGAGPCASSSHSSGVAMRSPSLSRAVTSASTVEGRAPGVMQLLAALFDRAFVGQFAQQALQVGAQVVLEVEGAGDLLGADLAGALADEGEKFGLGGEGGGLFGGFVQIELSCAARGADPEM